MTLQLQIESPGAGHKLFQPSRHTSNSWSQETLLTPLLYFKAAWFGKTDKY